MENSTLYFVEDGNRDGAVCTSWHTSRKSARACFERVKSHIANPARFGEEGDYALWGMVTVPDVDTVAVLLNRGRWSTGCSVLGEFILPYESDNTDS